ncbi:MAG: glycosyltransferase [Thermoplasmatales archaeon]
MESVAIKTINLPSATIIIPAYNEERRISGLLEELTDFISVNKIEWSIIVSIDGSDHTEDIVKGFSSKYPFVSHVKNGERSGKGGAIKRVIQRATGELIILMDADGSVKFTDILMNIMNVKDWDALIFNRYAYKENDIKAIRRIPSRAFNLLVRAFFGLKVKDTQCGFKVIRSKYAKEAFKKINVTNTFYDVALLYYIKMMGGKIREVNVKYNHNEDSKFNIIGEVLGQGVSLIAFRIRHSRFYKYIPSWATDLYLRKFRWI